MSDKLKELGQEPTLYEELLDKSSIGMEFYDKFNVINVLETCARLRHKVSVLNRRLLKVKAENRRLRKLLDGLKSIEIED